MTDHTNAAADPHLPPRLSLTEFILTRIAEDEAVAMERPSSAQVHASGCYYYDYSLDAGWFCNCDEDGSGTRRLLAECAAKRAIVERSRRLGGRYGRGIGDSILRHLAAVYAHHEDYREEWRG